MTATVIGICLLISVAMVITAIVMENAEMLACIVIFSLGIIGGIIIGSLSQDLDDKMILTNKNLGKYEFDKRGKITSKFEYVDISKYELKQGENDE